MRSDLWFASAAAILTLAGCVCAGFTMTLSVTPPSFQRQSSVPITVGLVNSGDETAYTGTVSIVHPPELSSKPILFDTMAPNVKNEKNVTVILEEPITPGLYPLVFSLQFHDSNNYPIYMIFDSHMRVKRHSVSKVHGTLSNLDLPSDKTGKIILKLKNVDSRMHTVDTRLILPDSLSSDSFEETIEIEPRSEMEVEYYVKNFMALPDSDFLVMATVEYEDEGVHYSSMAKGRVKVLRKEDKPNFLIAVGAVAVILGGYAYLKLRKNEPKKTKKKRKKSKKTR